MNQHASSQTIFIARHVVLCISYNTGKSALPDIYARRPRACSARGRVRIYQPLSLTINIDTLQQFS